MTGPGDMRISHTDRDRVAELLRTAAGEGRLDLDELEERLEATFAAKTYADLVPITVDLPGHTPARQPPAAASPRPAHGVPAPPPTGGDRLLAVMSGVDRRGDWVVPGELTITCVMGGAQLDLRQATFTRAETTFTINAVMGGAEIVVGPEVHVIVEGMGVMGAFTGPSSRVPAELGEDSPVLRVRGFALMGGVEVKRKRPPGELRRRLTGW